MTPSRFTPSPLVKVAPGPARALITLGAVWVMAACTGGTPWGATPQNLPKVDLPSLDNLGARIDAGGTAGSQRLTERVRAALAAQSGLAGASVNVDVLEGGLVVLSGRLVAPTQRSLALNMARQVPGTSQVLDRMVAP